MFDGRFDRAIREFSDVLAAGAVAGGIVPLAAACIVECMFIIGGRDSDARAVAQVIEASPQDPRHFTETVPAMAIAEHLTPEQCGEIGLLAAPRLLVLTHLYPPVEAVDIAALVSLKYAGPLAIAWDGWRMDLED